MSMIKQTFSYALSFLRNTFKYSRDVLFLHVAMLFGIIPLLSAAVRIILRFGGIAYLSFDNLSEIFFQHPFVLIGLLGVILLLLITLFFECTFLILSMYSIKIEQPLNLWGLIKMSLQTIKKIRPATILFFLFYFLLILPFGGIGYHSEILAQLKVPAFILDFIYSNRLIFVPVLILLYLTFLYLGVRFLFVLPLLILSDTPFRSALKTSWQLTKKNLFRLLFQAAFLYMFLLSLSFLVFAGLIACQTFIEHSFPSAAFQSAMTCMLILQLCLLFNKIFSGLIIFFLIFEFLELKENLPDYSLLQSKKTSRFRHTFGLQVIIAFFSILFVLVDYTIYDYRYLSGAELRKPLILSHRGVDGENGVQNSIEALQDTSKQHPAYVEMDIQQTKDHQFVVMHDFSLKDLTGVNQRVKDLTLQELQQLTVQENGMRAKIPSFDDYLEMANHLHQPLLIEMKIDKQPIEPILKRFVQRYRTNILEHQHIIHSLNFDFVTELKQTVPEFYVGYIMPFNVVGTPLTNADFFSIEYSTLTSHFVRSAHQDGKAVYAWTINSDSAAAKVIFDNVDGILTDRVSYIQTTVQEIVENPTYKDMLLNFALSFE